jgi:hypothetical protein
VEHAFQQGRQLLCERLLRLEGMRPRPKQPFRAAARPR